MRKIAKLTTSVAGAAALVLVGAACSSSSSSANSSTTGSSGSSSTCKDSAKATNVEAPPGYQVCIFASASTTANHPDNIAIDGSHVFVGWQNGTANNGSNGKSSTVIEYTTSGKQLHSWSVVGHADGMRVDPMNHVVWSMSNEDGNPILYTINPDTNAMQKYVLGNQPHGGGFDDIQFVNGNAYTTASNPTLTASGKNNHPSLYKITLSGTKATLAPVLSGTPTATTLNPPITKTKLNLTDPDSLMIDPQGNLVMDSQADAELLFIHHVGTPQQSVTVLPVGTQVDDTPFAPSAKATLLVSDQNGDVLSISSNFWVPGTPYTSVANDSPVASFIGTLNLGSGAITPIVIGIGNPHGMAFIPR